MMFKICLLLAVVLTVNGEFEEYFKWKQIQFAGVESSGDEVIFPIRGPNRRNPNQAASSSNYIAYNNVPMGATHFKDKIFVTVPRRRPGVPATLSSISVKSQKGSSPTFHPYPSQAINELHPNLSPDSNRIISVYRTRVDACNRLWFIDTGLLEYPNNNTQVQRPSIWIIDLATEQVIRRFEIPESVVARGNGLASVTVDVESLTCDDAYAYIPDLAAYRVYVYSLRKNRIWTFSHNYFNFDPLEGDFDVAGIRYQWNDGVFSITLSNRQPDGFKIAYFHPMASTSEFAVSTRVLRSSEMAERQNHGDDFKFLAKRGPNTQSAMHDFDKTTGVIFFSQVGINGASCWNTAMPLNKENVAIIVRNNETMIYPSDLNVDAEGIVWMMTNTMPRFIYSRLNPEEYNFRIWRQPVQDAIRGTICEGNRHHMSQFN